MSYQALLIGTIAFALLGVIAYLVSSFKIAQNFPDKEKQAYHKNIARGMCIMASVCMWAHWICCYMHQMNPLL